jgi:hypothetical protein
MPAFEQGRVHTDPKTDSQLRAALWGNQQQIDTLNEELDALDGIVGPVSAVFDATASVGQPVYVSSAGHVNLANANSTATAGVVGLCSTAASAGNSGEYISHGLISQANWTAVTGSASLTAGAVYYLDTTNGRLIANFPSSTVGHTAVRIGRALSTTTLSVAIGPRVLQ